jgi:hypothetical protein
MGGGTEAGRGQHLMAHLNHLEGKGPAPPWAKKTKRRGSFNHHFLWLVCAYADGQEGARENLIEWLEGQAREGHCVRAEAIETLSASHGHLNESATGVGLLFAEERKDRSLIELLRNWWWSEIVLCESCEVPGAAEKPWKKDLVTVWAPGWRALKKGVLVAWNPGRDNAYRLVKGYDVPSRKERPALYTTSRYDLAFRALSMLPVDSLKALRPAPGWTPPLPFPFHARRGRTAGADSAETMLAWFDAPENKDVALTASAREDGLKWVSQQGPGPDFFAQLSIDFPAVERKEPK